MKEKILRNGIYFRQRDIKKVGYYTTNKEGELVKHDYKEPSTWDKLKYKAKYGYPMDTNTISTSFFYFNRSNRVYQGSMMGDAISIAKELKMSTLGYKHYDYIIHDDAVIIDRGDYIDEIIFNEGEATLTAKSINKGTKQTLCNYIFTFLEWDYL